MFNHFAAFIECSTGTTPTVRTVKKFIDILSEFGYNELYLGCTDAYKMDGEPYFNYKRGGYTTGDFREMDAYAKEHGIELMANIQTLGHLDFLKRHESYVDMMDNDSILMVGDERVYTLVDKMFATISKGISSRRIHIGFDECWGLGTGNYLKKYGPADKKELLLRHLRRVVEIAEKYGYTCEIWHDMLIERDNTKVTAEQVKAAIPDGTRVFYWEYFEGNEKVIGEGIDNVAQHADLLGFAGAAFKCGTMTSMNGYSIKRLIAQMKVSKEKNLDSFMVTMWSDNGAWANNFSVLPTLYACSEYNFGRWDGTGEPDKARFREIVGVDYDAMMAFDYLDDPLQAKYLDGHANLSFLIILADIFNGGWDLMYSADMPEAYAKLSEYFARVDGGEYSYLFKSYDRFANVLSLKCRLGVEIRDAYKNGDKKALEECVTKLVRLKAAFEEFAEAFANQWLHDNSPFGLEVCQTFLGGQILRTQYVISRINEYLSTGNKINEIEAETVRPDIPAWADQYNYWNSNWKTIVSNCGF